ncbi:MAG TPA: tetratricopeptide repeat protein [Nitrospirales bacterium]|nr:tetratricopeptide repeat protein [Nitrospirales bacterium]
MTTWCDRWTALVLLAFVLSGCGSAEERKASYVAKANAFRAEGNFPKARVALLNALKIDPKDPHVYFLAGQVFEKEANWSQAFRRYARVLELDSTHREALGRLARFYLAAQDSKELQALADTVLAQDPQDVLGLTLQDCAWFLAGEKSKALSHADALLKQNLTDPDILLMLAVVFSANQEFEKAQSILQRGLTVHHGHVDLLNYLATISIGMKDFDNAEVVYLQLLETEPHVFSHRDTLAGLYRYLGKSDKSHALLRAGVALDPDNEQHWKSLVTYAESAQREELLHEALQALPHSLTLRFLLGAHYEQIQDYQKARDVYDALLTEEESSGEGLKAEVELAKLDFAEQNAQSAQTRLANVLKEHPRQFDALLLKGKLALAQKEGRSAVEAFRIVLKDEPNNSAIQSLLGQAHLLAGEFELAKESLEKAVAVNSRQFDAYTALARLSAREGELDQAQHYLEAILNVVPTHIESLWSLFQLQLGQRQWTQGELTITRLEKAGGSAYQIDLAKGFLASGRQQWDRAVQAFIRAQQTNPDALPPLAALVNVHLQRKQPEQAQAYLQKMVSDYPEHPFAWGLLGGVLVQLHDAPLAIPAYQKATEVNPAWVEPWKDWATLVWAQGQKSEAIDILNVALTKHAQSPLLLPVLAAFYQTDGQTDLAIRQYESILSLSPNDVVAANNLAYLLADKKGDPRNLDKALALTKDFEAQTQNPFLLDTLAWVYYKMGLLKEATSVLNKALAKAPDHALINYHFGLLALQTGDRATAHTHLEKAVQRPSELEHIEDARRLLAEMKQ